MVIKPDHCPFFINANSIKSQEVGVITHRCTQIVWCADIKLSALK